MHMTPRSSLKCIFVIRVFEMFQGTSSMSREFLWTKHVLKQLYSNVLHHRTKSFHSSWSFRLQHDKACNMVNCPESTQTDYPHCWPCERTMTLTFHIFIFRSLSKTYWTICIPMLISVLFCLFCHVLALIVFVLQVGVKNIPIHNNYVPFGQLRDLKSH